MNGKLNMLFAIELWDSNNWIKDKKKEGKKRIERETEHHLYNSYLRRLCIE